MRDRDAERQRERLAGDAFKTAQRQECVRTQRKIVKPACSPRFWLLEMVVAVRISRFDCKKAAKVRISKPQRVSSG
jgi:hypothetical protein